MDDKIKLLKKLAKLLKKYDAFIEVNTIGLQVMSIGIYPQRSDDWEFETECLTIDADELEMEVQKATQLNNQK